MTYGTPGTFCSRRCHIEIVSLCLFTVIFSSGGCENSSQRTEVPDYPPQPLPTSGQVRSFTTQTRIAPFQIKAAQGSHCLLKLVNSRNKATALTIFVQGGTAVNIRAPLETYEVRYAAGETWYGDDLLFGPGTSYSKADKTFAFNQVGNDVRGFTITLYKVLHGNLSTSTIDR
jgi:hypothetical protein